ncbi:MAG: hypothetical protein LIP28_07565 [Deltaproteobacteria bacterium]|nr:hypothetical protein [Deltaproteobacteria bacterium]
MRSLIRLAVFAVAITAFVTGTALADGKTAVQQRIDELLANDPDFARSEKALDAARDAFLHVFSGVSKIWAVDFLERNGKIRSYDLDAFSRSDEYGKKERAEFLQKRADLARYMTLVTQTPFTDPAFLILLKPVCRNAVQYSDKNLVRDTLAEYDAHAADPYKDRTDYRIRRVNGQYWAAILLPHTEIGSSSGSDRNMAFVLRVTDGSFFLHPIIAPVKEDFYPGEKSPLRPEKYAYGPGNVSINECAMEGVLTVTNEFGPFAFRADAGQSFAKPALSYMCEPKCSGFTYTWNDTSGSFIMADGTCRDDDGWKPRSPFDADDNLLPVAGYMRKLAGEDEAVRKHREAVENALAAFLDSFDGEARELAQGLTDGWLFDRQFPLYRLVGDKAAFTEAYRKNDEPVLRYLRTVASLAKTPDARLTLLMEDFADRLALDGKERERLRNTGRYPAPSDLLRGNGKPAWFVTHALEQLSRLEPPNGEQPVAPAYTASGLEGGETITLTYDPKQFFHRSEGDAVANTYTMRRGSDEASWGHGLLAVGKRLAYGNAYSHFLETPRQYMLRVADGKISFVTPLPPEEKEFFTRPKVDRRGKVLWTIPGERRAAVPCAMTPVLEVDASAAPFAVTAKDVPLYRDYYLCVPECSVPYAWNGNAYVKGTPECLPDGQWGVRENPERNGN